jgi:sarcosine oxidase subunit delta
MIEAPRTEHFPMLLIPCPWCGEREETEFRCGGEAHILRPKEPAALTDQQWVDYLFMRTNPKGVHCERWRHVHGCGRWFNLARDTVSDRILAVYQMGEPRPKIDRDATAAAPAAAKPGPSLVAARSDEAP